MDGQPFINLPLFGLVLFAIIGVASSWRRSASILTFAYVSLVLAAQHADTLARWEIMNVLSNNHGTLELSGQAYAVIILITFIILNIVSSILWDDSTTTPQDDPALGKLLQGFVTGAAGWILGSVLAASLMVGIVGNLNILQHQLDESAYIRSIEMTNRVVFELVTPWLPGELPEFQTILFPKKAYNSDPGILSHLDSATRSDS